MNFTKPEDFKHVVGGNAGSEGHGDLDLIQIDNNVMPKRTGDAQKAIRGMDIAFLMEAVEERAVSVGLEEQTHVFYNSLLLDSINSIIDRYNDIADVSADYQSAIGGFRACDEQRAEMSSIYDRSSGTYISGNPQDHIHRLTRKENVTDDKLLFDTVKGLFDAIQELNRIQLWLSSTYFYGISGTVNGYVDRRDPYGLVDDALQRLIDDVSAHGYNTFSSAVSSSYACHARRNGMTLTSNANVPTYIGEYALNVKMVNRFVVQKNGISHYWEYPEGLMTVNKDTFVLSKAITDAKVTECANYYGYTDSYLQLQMSDGFLLIRELASRTRWDIEDEDE